mmetsp:Transcript_16620/g.25010  ORF Transcript_16620/g.25010 Transcript_16620/m.25010 type:complete len:484 (-) Transcript_16620:228-1679(-)
MSSSRRGSIKFVPKPTPYRITHSNQQTGKTIAGTKRKVTWRFGWCDSDREHEVLLVHSVLSGKRVISEDGREITSASNPFSSDFSHGWESSGHLFRVEADTSVATDPTYVFTIDSVRFEDFQRKPTTLNKPAVAQQATETTKNKPVTRAPEKVEKQETGGTFDPFSPTGRATRSGSFDPFSSSERTERSASFDPFGSSEPTQGATTDAFGGGAFGTDQKVSSQSDGFDAFGTLSSGQSSDPFSHPSQSAAVQPKAQTAAEFDFFSDPTPSTSQNQPQKTSNDILNEFSGLTFDMPPPPPTSHDTGATVVANNPDPTPAPAPPQKKDQWSGLVDLDLKGNGPRPQTSTAQSGPSLNQMTTSGGTGPSVMKSPQATASQQPSVPFGVTHMGGSGGGGFPVLSPQNLQPQQPRQSQSADPFASFTSSQPQQQHMGMGGGMYSSNSAAISSLGSAGTAPAMGRGRGFAAPPQNQTAPSSLDSLNWKM